MSDYPKYKYPQPIPMPHRKWPDAIIQQSPVWASVDLRDGNQALPIPMNPEKKLEYFQMLVNIGFKEIEVSFPAASQDDFDFVRCLIEGNHIPEDVKISVLTQAREHLIDRTVASLVGAKQAIVHCYVATSDLHGRFVFGDSRDEVMEMAIAGTKMVKAAIEKYGMTGKIGYEFSPEEFTDSDLDFTLEICKKVKETWGPSQKSDFILNLPATVERRPPNQYADMIEYFREHYPYLEETTISLHAHNDQGCAVAATELALLAGADRVEGTIFGHGERTGNLDIMVLALNLHSRGIDTHLDFSNMTEIVHLVEANSCIEVHPRHPYAGALAFTAFSGSHQDAIRKGMEQRSQISEFFQQGWKMPYLHIDPADVGRSYEKLIRINSQSGKGGIAYILEKEFGIYPPKAMHPEIGRVVQKVADETGVELDSQMLYDIFMKNFVNITGPFALTDFEREILEHEHGDWIGVRYNLRFGDQVFRLTGEGNGPISAVVRALLQCEAIPRFELEDFSERTLGVDAHAKAMAFIGIRYGHNRKLIYGAGIHSNIDRAAIAGLICALNRAYALYSDGMAEK